jgi:TPR repeat protein
MEAGYVPAYNLYNSYVLRTDTSALLGFMPRLEELAEYDASGSISQHLYNNQHGIPMARRRAIRWIQELATELGNPSSMGDFAIGSQYVLHQFEAARRWARRGAYSGGSWPVSVLALQAGGAEGQRLYAFSFQRGLERAETGNGSDMFHVAEALIAGNGVEEDRAEGARWMRLSAAAGEPRAITYLQTNSWARAPEEQGQ